ncbi:fumarate hydratase [Cysteiniphilum sp. QT6929]|uniref:fumarate hydratase n=1 Tax=Cysteiniphilum sp. QT6929 TaxID=2975055 RepID=UPI0024B368A9|nr:fumarate hydratase [Cysteiniphilum sp. QT6929]WHN65185.1 fumarate hydratase [Cysteiniphilum sp. QT6929]
MSIIKVEDFIQSVADGLQFISYYHPKDFVQAMYCAYEHEASKPAKDAIGQILINSRMAAYGHRPICQDTGMVCAFVKVGMEAKLDRTDRTITELVNEGVRRAYLNADNPLRASMVNPPHGARKNTKDNTPAIVHIDMVAGSNIEIELAAKGGGSEFKSKFKVLNPSDSIVDWVLEMLPTMGAGWCPPGIIGIGIGGTAEKAMLLAKESLGEEIDMHEILERGAQTELEKLRVELYHKINDLGIGAQGLGGLTTVLDVKIHEYPTHAACKPVALIPNCAATRHVHFTLDGSGVAKLPVPKLEDWPEITETDKSQVRRVDLNTLTQADIENLKPGETLLLNGKLLTGRDAAHKRIMDMVKNGEPLPVDLKGKFIYYVGPVDPVGDEVVGPAGPTTATRMDKFTDFMLSEVGIAGMVGKAERGQATIDSIKKHKAVYLMAVGGAAYLISKSIRKAKVVGFEELGMEAIYEFEVEDMPVTVAVDSQGTSVHQTGPKEWKVKIAEMHTAGK